MRIRLYKALGLTGRQYDEGPVRWRRDDGSYAGETLDGDGYECASDETVDDEHDRETTENTNQPAQPALVGATRRSKCN